MAQAIMVQAQAMTAQVNRHDVQRDNPLVRSMADRLRDFTRMNPPIFIGAKTSEDPQEFIDEVHKILVAMGATDIEKAELLSRDEMSRFLTGINGDLEEECRSVMLHDNIDLSRLMVHVQKVEDSRKRKGVRDIRQPRPQDQSGHMVRDCPQNRGQAGGNAQPRPTPQSAAAAEPPKRNRFYALKGREEHEKSADVVTGSELFFVTPLLALTFEILPEVCGGLLFHCCPTYSLDKEEIQVLMDGDL
ncbi:uncharacterized protein LOC107030326 [Solanum pennellii]|uniref:Uncharacterized protein LOC107030326 n=1 Tax=Solanum pennellii TaxID=28526 RepID=A0ABM1UWB3_SOLPN|nr:uncharacterized protein LOC107030326 [Solanum pennellii]